MCVARDWPKEDSNLQFMIRTMEKSGSSGKLNEILSSLRELNRSDLLCVLRETNHFLSLECADVVACIPDDIWQTIFLFMLRTMNLTSSIEPSLRLLSCVSTRWSALVDGLVRCYFSFDRCHSSWILSRFHDLTSLTLNGDGMSSLVDGIGKLTNLTTLVVPFDQVPLRDISLKNLTNLTKLKVVFGEFLSDNGISHLSKLNILKILKDCSLDNGLRALTNLVSLQVSSVSDDTLAYLPHLSKLLDPYEITDYGLSKLTNLTSLRGHANIRFTDESIRCLTNLTKLDLQENDISEFAVMHLTKLSNLSFENANITDECYLRLSHLTFLSILPNNNLTYHGFKNLTKLSELILLDDLDDTTNIFESLDCLSSLSELYLFSDRMNDNSLVQLSNLTFLNLIVNSTINDRALKCLTNLRKLDLSENEVITYDGIKDLPHLTKLILMDNRNIRNKQLKLLTNLRSLNISWREETCRIVNSGIMNLTNLSTLKFNRNTSISLLGLIPLCNLRKIEMSETAITFQDIRHLTNLTSIVCGRYMLSIWEKKNFPLLRRLEYKWDQEIPVEYF